MVQPSRLAREPGGNPVISFSFSELDGFSRITGVAADETTLLRLMPSAILQPIGILLDQARLVQARAHLCADKSVVPCRVSGDYLTDMRFNRVVMLP
jgi:hypothetical protein